MDPITQLVGSFFGNLLLLAVLVMLMTPFLWMWLWFRLMRDIHSISESLHWIAHCTQPQDAASDHTSAGKVPLSMFGR